jgi:rubrerythrin
MELGAVLLLAAVAIGVGFFVAIPFMEGRRAAASASDQELSSLLAERDRLINALQELDFDYTLGKIPAEAYPAQREELLRNGAGILRRIDTLNASASPERNDAESRIEAAVAARRADAASQLTPALAAVDDDIESRVSARRSERKDQSGGFCPNCGKPVLSSDRFCPHCGKSIK